jgi:hypothetical protein
MPWKKSDGLLETGGKLSRFKNIGDRQPLYLTKPLIPR